MSKNIDKENKDSKDQKATQAAIVKALEVIGSELAGIEDRMDELVAQVGKAEVNTVKGFKGSIHYIRETINEMKKDRVA